MTNATNTTNISICQQGGRGESSIDCEILVGALGKHRLRSTFSFSIQCPVSCKEILFDGANILAKINSASLMSLHVISGLVVERTEKIVCKNDQSTVY